MTRIEEILVLLEARGPMTVVEMSEALGITEKTTNLHLHAFRKHQRGIRITGYQKVGPTKKHRLYGIGEEPDVQYPNPRRSPSAVKRIKHPGLTREEIVERKRIRELSAQSKPFRDEMIFMTAGRAP